MAGAIVGGVVLVILVGGFESRMNGVLEITASSVAGIETGLEIATDTLADVESALGATQTALDTASTSLRDVAGVTASVVRLMNEELPGQIDAIRGALDGLIETARVVDDVLSAAALIGLDYDPDQPLDVSLEALDEELSGLTPILESEAERLFLAASSLVDLSVAVDDVETSLRTLESDLQGAEAALADYSALVASAADEIESTQADLRGQLLLARLVVAFFALLAALLSSRMWWTGRATRVHGQAGPA